MSKKNIKYIYVIFLCFSLFICASAEASDASVSNFNWISPQTLLPQTSEISFGFRFELAPHSLPYDCSYDVQLYLSLDTVLSGNDFALFDSTDVYLPAGAMGFSVEITRFFYSDISLPSAGTYYVFIKVTPGLGAPMDTNNSNNSDMDPIPIQVGQPDPNTTFIPIPGRKAHVFDPVNRILYTTTNSGAVERYDVRTDNFLSSWAIGGNLGGIDVTPDGGTVLVADQDTANNVGYIHSVDASSGIVTTHELDLCEGEQFDGSVLSFDPLSGKIYVSYRDGIGIHPLINTGHNGDTEDFETNDFSKFPWVRSGDANWTTTSQESSSGLYSAKAGSISDNEVTTLQVTLECIAGDITFYRKVSSESGYDYLKFYIDGQLKEQWSGEQDWEEVSFPVTAGTRTFKWTYSKDNSLFGGNDTAWIDNIAFPIAGGAQIAANGEMHPNQFNSKGASEQSSIHTEFIEIIKE